MQYVLITPSDVFVSKSLTVINKRAGAHLRPGDFEQIGSTRIGGLNREQVAIQTDLSEFSRVGLAKLVKPDVLEPSFLLGIFTAVLALIAAIRG